MSAEGAVQPASAFIRFGATRVGELRRAFSAHAGGGHVLGLRPRLSWAAARLLL